MPSKKKANKKKSPDGFVEPPVVLPDLVPYDDFVTVKDIEPLEISAIADYDDEPSLLSLSNRIATDVEREHIFKIIQRQTSSLNQLEESIKVGTIARDESQATVDSIRRSLMVAKSHRVIIQRRLDSQATIEAEASLTEQLIRQEKGGGDDIYTEALKEFDTELAMVRQTIEQDLQALSKITIRIQELEKGLVEACLMLQLENDSLKSFKRCQTLISDTVTRYKTLLHRGRDLPNELLLKIFGFSVNSEIELVRSNPDNVRTFAVLKLSSICQHWRHVVHQVPYLWQYIPLPSSCDENLLEVFRLYARNSVGTPHVIIHFSPKGSEPVQFLGWGARTYDMDATRPNPLTFYLDTSIAETLSRTSSIEFIRRDSYKETSDIDCNWPITTYSLRHFIPKFTESASTRVSKLIIHTGNMSSEQVHRLHATLLTLPKLQYLSIHVGRVNVTGNWGAVVNLGSLETLSIQLKLVAEIFGTGIVAPKLRCLHVTGRSDHAAFQPEKWQRVISQAGLVAIQKVILENLTLSAPTATGLLSVLDGLVGVETLELIGNPLSTTLSTLITRPLLSPALRTLVIRDSNISGSIIKQFIQSRMHVIEGEAVRKSIIRKVELDGSSKIDLTCCEEIREMVDTLVVTDRCHFVH